MCIRRTPLSVLGTSGGEVSDLISASGQCRTNTLVVRTLIRSGQRSDRSTGPLSENKAVGPAVNVEACEPVRYSQEHTTTL